MLEAYVTTTAFRVANKADRQHGKWIAADDGNGQSIASKMYHYYNTFSMDEICNISLIAASLLALTLVCMRDQAIAHIVNKVDNFEKRFNAWDDRYDEWEDYFDDWDDRIPEEQEEDEEIVNVYRTYETVSGDYVHYIKYMNGDFMLILPQNKAVRGKSILNVFLRRETRSTRGHVQMTYLDTDYAVTTISVVRNDVGLSEFLSEFIDE